jgi:hypothetical protein
MKVARTEASAPLIVTRTRTRAPAAAGSATSGVALPSAAPAARQRTGWRRPSETTEHSSV